MRVIISQSTRDMNAEEMAKARTEVISMLDEQGHEVWGEEKLRENIPIGVDQDLWRLGRRLQAMAEADAVYFMDGWEKDRGCRLEYEACRLYGKIPMNNHEFGILDFLEFARRYSPEALDEDHARCQICGAQGALPYGMYVKVKVSGLGYWKFNERIIFLCEAHKKLAQEREVKYLEPNLCAPGFGCITQPWPKMSPKMRFIIYNLAKNMVEGYEARWGKNRCTKEKSYDSALSDALECKELFPVVFLNKVILRHKVITTFVRNSAYCVKGRFTYIEDSNELINNSIVVVEASSASKLKEWTFTCGQKTATIIPGEKCRVAKDQRRYVNEASRLFITLRDSVNQGELKLGYIGQLEEVSYKLDSNGRYEIINFNKLPIASSYAIAWSAIF